MVRVREDLIVFNVVAAAGATNARLEEFRRYAAEALGPGIKVELRFVDELKIGPGGKYWPAYSKVHSDYEPIDWDRAAP
jgi:hypothetical protein